MSNNITVSPGQTIVAPGSFGVSWDGLVQGTAFPDPTTRFALAGGFLDSGETLPMFGGVAISEFVPGVAGGPDPSLGGNVKRATAVTGGSAPITGFSVFDQAYGMINSPNNPVPIIGTYGQVMFYRLGSGARIAVAMDAGLVSLEGTLITSSVSWDFNNQVLAPTAGAATYALTSAAWANAGGGQLTIVAAVATPVTAIGDEVNISGATNTGTGGVAAINSNFTVVAFTDNQHFVLAAPAAAGVFGTIAGSPVLNYDTVALPCKILRVQPAGCMVVAKDTLGNYVWNRNGAAAVIQI